MKNTTLMILAAGMGSRYGGLKQMDAIGPNGETIIDYSLFDALKAGFNKIVFIIRKDFFAEFKKRFDPLLDGKCEVIYVFQELDSFVGDQSLLKERTKPWGTGHAMLVAKDAINEPFAVINADDYYGQNAFKQMDHYLSEEITPNNHCMMGYLLKNTLSDNGHVSRGVCGADSNDNLIEINERTKIKRFEDGQIRFIQNDQSIEVSEESIVSMNFWGFHPSIFHTLELGFIDFLKEEGNKKDSEFFIPIVVNKIINHPKSTIKVLRSPDKWFGVTYREDKEMVVSAINDLIQGGSYPSRLWE